MVAAIEKVGGSALISDEMGLFQSLFSWSGRCNINCTVLGICITYVSILIFMEWSLQCFLKPIAQCCKCRFNPYFHGVVAAIYFWMNIERAMVLSFNPYFHGVVAAIYDESHIELLKYISFNPYFHGVVAAIQ